MPLGLSHIIINTVFKILGSLPMPLFLIELIFPKKEMEIVVYVSPNSIKFFSLNKLMPPEINNLFLIDGDWDLSLQPIDYYENVSASYKSMRQIFCEHLPYEKTQEYINKKQLLDEGLNLSRKISDIEGLKNYFDSLIDLENSIRNLGYKSQKDLNGRELDEIGVFIDRNGNLIKPEDKQGGTHRFALSKIKNLEAIPVVIRAVHLSWIRSHRKKLFSVKMIKNLIRKKFSTN